MSELDFSVVCSRIEKEKANLQRISMEIWHNPELCYKEFHAHSVLTDALQKYGFSVTKSYIVDTAFRAEYSNGNENGAVVTVLCEYDALPEIGHACGHNLIAEVGVATAIGIKAVMDSDRELCGKVVVLGCPAEEGGGGKIKLIENGAFKDVDIAIMSHPGKRNRVHASLLGREQIEVIFRGKEAHAAVYPWEGRNALDAAVAGYVNVGLLRQQVNPACRIHGIITNGGEAPNIIPAYTRMLFFARAPSSAELSSLSSKLKSCFESAAQATGCQVEVNSDKSNTYLNMISNKVLGALYEEYSEKLGVEFARSPGGGSSDIGNVSYVLPTLHPGFKIGEHGIHTKECTQQAATDEAHQEARRSAKGLALTALKIMRSPDLLQKCKEEFQEQVRRMSEQN